MSSPISEDENIAINPRPTAAEELSQCPQCKGNLGIVRCGKGMGKYITNYGRWFQLCPNRECNHMHFYNPPTPEELVPFEVKIRFAKKTSAEEIRAHISCEEPNCLTAEGKPRAANKFCSRSPQCCLTCCRNKSLIDGRACKKHKIKGNPALNVSNPGNSPSTSTEINSLESSAQSGADSESALASKPIPEPPAYSRRLYGRALHEGYAKNRLDPQLERLRVREESSEAMAASNKVLATLKNTIVVVFWTKAGVLPTRVNVLPQIPEIVTMVEQPFIFNAYKALDIQMIAYLDTTLDYLLVEWIVQDISFPVVVHSQSRQTILMRPAALDPSECLNLDVKIREALQQKSGPAQGAIRKRLHQDAFKPDHQSPSSSNAQSPTALPAIQSQSHPAGSLLNPPSKRVSLGLAKFPGPQLQHVCTLAPGLEQLAYAHTTDSILSAFRHAFPGYQPVIATVYRYRSIYLASKNAGILQKYINYGQTANGEWTKLKKEIQELQKQGTISQNIKKGASYSSNLNVRTINGSQNKVINSEEQDSDGEFDYEVFPFIRESFQYHNGVIVSNIANLNEVQNAVFFFKPLAIGLFRNVHYVIDRAASDIVVKKLRIPENWWAREECTLEVATFVDAQRLYEAQGLAMAFKNFALGRDVKIYPFKFADTFLAQRMGAVGNEASNLTKVFETFIGQANLHGQHFQSRILGQIDEDIAQTLAAFQHYIYDFKNGRMAINDFQGKCGFCIGTMVDMLNLIETQAT